MVWRVEPHPQTNFRAFLTLEDGAYDHVAFLSRRERYRLAWAALKLGDPDVYVGELKRAGYFTAGEAAYKKAVVSLFNEYLRMLSKPTEEQEATLTGEELDAIVVSHVLQILPQIAASAGVETRRRLIQKEQPRAMQHAGRTRAGTDQFHRPMIPE